MVRQVALCLATLLVSAVDASAAPTPPPAPSQDVSLAASVKLQGNREFAEAELRKTMLRATTLEEAAGMIETAYLARGFLRVRVTPSPPLGASPALLTIDEGARFRLRAIDVVEVGAQAKRDALGDEKALRSLLTVRAGEFFDRERLAECMRTLRDRYDDAGYGMALVTPVTDVDTDQYNVGVRLEIDRGLRRKINAVEVHGSPDEARVRRVLLIKPGDVFSQRKQDSAEKRLRAQGTLPRATIEAFDEPAGIRMVVTVGEHGTPVTDLVKQAVASHGAYQAAVSLADEIGARLAGSPAAARAVAWAERAMKVRGFHNVHTEPVTVEAWSRGANDRVELVAPYARVLHALALGRSPGTPAAGVTAEVIEVDSFDALARLGDKVRGKIVFFNKVMPRSKGFDQYGTIGALRFRGAIEAGRLGAVAALVRSVGTGSHRLPHTGAAGYDPQVPSVPFAALAAEDAQLLHRALARGPAKVTMRLSCGMRGLVSSANVVGEIRGRDKPEEIVLIGAHLDSWDVGDGALDDGAGVGIVLEAATRLKEIGTHRTVRVVLFMNEECGLSGARAYAKDHAAEAMRHVAAMEADAGGGAPLGFWATGGESAKAMVTKWAKTLAHYGVTEVESTDETGSDLIPLQALGVPTVAVKQDASDYFEWHHTDGDTADKLVEGQIDLAAGVFAAMAAMLANGSETLPRLPPTKLER